MVDICAYVRVDVLSNSDSFEAANNTDTDNDSLAGANCINKDGNSKSYQSYN